MASRAAAAGKEEKGKGAAEAPPAMSRAERARAYCRSVFEWANLRYYVVAALLYAVLFAVYWIVSNALPEAGPLEQIDSGEPLTGVKK